MEDKKYIDSIHRLGRWGCIGSVAFMMLIPVVVCVWFGCMPAWSILVQPIITILIMKVPTTCSEVISYAPTLGTSTYLSFITGNVANMKLPAAIAAQNIAEVEPSTPEADAVSTMAVALSTLVTLIIMALGVVLFVPLQPILNAPVFKTATSYLVPALLGGLVMSSFGNGNGKRIIKNKLLIVLLPLALGICASLFIPKFSSYMGYAIIVTIIVTIGWAYLLYKRNIVYVTTRNEK